MLGFMLMSIDKLDKKSKNPHGSLIHLVKLKQCPFCGRQATIVRNPGSNWDGKKGENVSVGACFGLWFVGCSYVFFEDQDTMQRCELAPAASWYAKLEEAVKQWNTRAK